MRRNLSGEAEQNVWRWFGCMERMEKDRLGEENSWFHSKRCEVERKAKNEMDGRCEKSVE